MSSPLFNTNPIFDSLDSTGANFSEGVLVVESYSAIDQVIHFNGEVGSWRTRHGYPDMPWSFEGTISATTQTAFNNVIKGIQSAIDDGQAGNYHTLVDSFGNYYHNAQVSTFTYLMKPHIWMWNNSGTAAFGYVCGVKVTGIVQGNTHVGATS